MIYSKKLLKLATPILRNSTISTPFPILNIKRFCTTTTTTTTGGSDKDKDNEDGNFKLDDIYKTLEKDLNIKTPTLSATTEEATIIPKEEDITIDKPKKGRPKGSKNTKTIKPTEEPTTTTTTISPPKTNITTPGAINSGKKYSVTFISQNEKENNNKIDNFIKENPEIFEPLITNIIHTVEQNQKNSSNNNDESDSTSSPTYDLNTEIQNLLSILKQPTNKSKPANNPAQQQMKYNLTEEMMGEDNLLPKEIVKELDQYIIGQPEAKRAVSIALRNRWRRKRLDPSIRSDVYPKNILMIGPTGVGKTELARQLAKIVNAPFVKVEATKYTEVGYHGPDVDTIIRDLIEASIANIKTKIANSRKAAIDADIEKDIISALVGPDAYGIDGQNSTSNYEELAKKYRNKLLDAIEIEIDVPANIDNIGKSSGSVSSAPIQFDANDSASFIKLVMPSVGGGSNDKSMKKRRMAIGEAREILKKVYKEKYTATQDVTRLAIQAAEQNGIVFLDEIDKICTPRDSVKNGGDASTDGVQRDLLPIIEGCNVNTKYGTIDTSRILFIASGAFHSSKPSDLISELQGRLPIRVELKPLDQHDFYRILTEPKNNQIQQQVALLKTEDIELQFTQDALLEVARIAFEANAQVQNLGARRLHGIIERIVEELSFNCDGHKGKTVILDSADVRKHLNDLLFKTDLSKYII